MSIRNVWVAVAVAGAMASAFGNEAGYIEFAPQFGVAAGKAAITDNRAGVLAPGQVSSDGRYVFLGSETGWSARPHTMMFQGGGLVHGEDCVHAAAKPGLGSTDQEKALSREIQIGG